MYGNAAVIGPFRNGPFSGNAPILTIVVFKMAGVRRNKLSGCWVSMCHVIPLAQVLSVCPAVSDGS
jgi:hypothetical protein